MSGQKFIVVPDGLRADGSGRALPEPSFIFRAVLDAVAERASRNDTIYLAPANKFGGEVTEHDAASRYLANRSEARLVVPNISSAKYIDTRGNARLLQDYLRSTGEWPIGPAVLCSYFLHLPRAKIVFAQSGFEVSEAWPAKLRKSTRENVVSRLWYYNYPPVHRAYENAATVASVLRLI